MEWAIETKSKNKNNHAPSLKPTNITPTDGKKARQDKLTVRPNVLLLQ
jgi:hypothetical protein